MSNENVPPALDGITPQNDSLADRARSRRAELEKALTTMPADDTSGRKDIDAALAAIEVLMVGDPDNPAPSTAAEMSRWLESSRHLGESPPKAGPPTGN